MIDQRSRRNAVRVSAGEATATVADRTPVSDAHARTGIGDMADHARTTACTSAAGSGRHT